MYFVENVNRREVLEYQFEGFEDARRWLDECGAEQVDSNKFMFDDELFIIIAVQ